MKPLTSLFACAFFKMAEEPGDGSVLPIVAPLVAGAGGASLGGALGALYKKKVPKGILGPYLGLTKKVRDPKVILGAAVLGALLGGGTAASAAAPSLFDREKLKRIQGGMTKQLIGKESIIPPYEKARMQRDIVRRGLSSLTTPLLGRGVNSPLPPSPNVPDFRKLTSRRSLVPLGSLLDRK